MKILRLLRKIIINIVIWRKNQTLEFDNLFSWNWRFDGKIHLLEFKSLGLLIKIKINIAIWRKNQTLKFTELDNFFSWKFFGEFLKLWFDEKIPLLEFYNFNRENYLTNLWNVTIWRKKIQLLEIGNFSRQNCWGI